jgi:hypothetical protein
VSNISTHRGKSTFGRRTSLVHALLQIGGVAPFRCTVHQIDDDGAEIELSRPVVLPRQVRLYWEQYGDSAECEVVGTEGPTVRVTFTSGKGSEILRRFEADRASQRQRAGI